MNDEISVIRDTKFNDYQLTVANHYLTEGMEGIGDFEVGKSQERYDIITNAVNQAKGIMDEGEAMNVLSQAVMKDIHYDDSDFPTNTQWSAVYNLNKLSLDLCIDMDYENVYSFKL